jgi:hypothetical protein
VSPNQFYAALGIFLTIHLLRAPIVEEKPVVYEQADRFEDSYDRNLTH